MTVKTLTEEFWKWKMPNELTVLRKKVNEVEDALKMCNDSKEVMKDQLRVLEQKVEILQKTKGLSISNNGDKEETTVPQKDLNAEIVTKHFLQWKVWGGMWARVMGQKLNATVVIKSSL